MQVFMSLVEGEVPDWREADENWFTEEEWKQLQDDERRTRFTSNGQEGIRALSCRRCGAHAVFCVGLERLAEQADRVKRLYRCVLCLMPSVPRNFTQRAPTQMFNYVLHKSETHVGPAPLPPDIGATNVSGVVLRELAIGWRWHKENGEE